MNKYVLCILQFLFYFAFFSCENPTNDKIICKITKKKYNGNNTIATAYKIAPVKANPDLLRKHPNPLKIVARTVQIMCGITSAVAIAAPACSAPLDPPTAPVKYAIMYTEYNNPKINAINKQIFFFILFLSFS